MWWEAFEEKFALIKFQLFFVPMNYHQIGSKTHLEFLITQRHVMPLVNSNLHFMPARNVCFCGYQNIFARVERWEKLCFDFEWSSTTTNEKKLTPNSNTSHLRETMISHWNEKWLLPFTGRIFIYKNTVCKCEATLKMSFGG